MKKFGEFQKNNANVNIIVPFTPCVWAFSDPTHKQFYTYFTFNYFSEKSKLKYYSKIRFDIDNIKIKFNPYLIIFEWIFNSFNLVKKIYAIFLYPLIPAMFLEFKLKVRK